jgi:peptide/nickel transport system substrate-binding protein
MGDKARKVQGPGGSPAYALLNVTQPPFDDVRVRQAVYLWLDRPAIAEKALQGNIGFVGQWFEANTFPGGYGSTLEELQKKDIAYAADKTAARKKAMEIMAAAGYDDLSKIKLSVISRGTSPTGATVLGSQVIASQLQEMGFDVTFQSQEQLAAVEMFRSLEGWHATMYTSSLPYPAPEAMMGRYLHSTGQRNYSGHVDETVDNYVAQVLAATEESERRRLISEFEDYLSEGKNATFFIYFSGVEFLEQSYVHSRRFVSSWFSQYDVRTWLDSNSPTR